MKKILHLGCSWSQFNHEGQKGVPENTVEVLKEKNVDVLYYSASHGGCDLGTQFEVLKSEIGKGYDFIIFQVTSDSRHHIRTGHYNLDWTPTVSHPNIYKCDVSLRKTGNKSRIPKRDFDLPPEKNVYDTVTRLYTHLGILPK